MAADVGYSQPYEGCLRWLRPRHTAPVVPAKATPLPATVPLLIVGGDVDSLTPLSDAQGFGPRLGRRCAWSPWPNTVHVTSEGDTYLVEGADCGRRDHPGLRARPGEALDAIDASCAAQIRPDPHAGRLPGEAGRRCVREPRIRRRAGPIARQAATVAAGALADATIRRYYSGAANGPGLRGGRFTVKEGTPLRFNPEAGSGSSATRVSGTGTYRFSDGAVSGSLTVTPASGAAVRLKVSWTQRSALATATVGGATLSLPAP